MKYITGHPIRDLWIPHIFPDVVLSLKVLVKVGTTSLQATAYSSFGHSEKSARRFQLNNTTKKNLYTYIRLKSSLNGNPGR